MSNYEIKGSATVPDIRGEADGQERHALLVSGPNGVVTILAPTEAEARMFAAGADTLVACQRVAAYLSIHDESYWRSNADADRLRAAIAKAKPKGE